MVRLSLDSSQLNLTIDCSGLMDLLHKYKKLIERHQATSLTGRAKSYFFDAKKVKEQIKELREDVTKLEIGFLVSHSLDIVDFVADS